VKKNVLTHLNAVLLTAVLLTVSGLALFGAGLAYAQPAFVNGSFETNAWPPGQVDQITPSGWSAVQSTDSRFVQGVHNTADTTSYHTPYGNQFIVLCAEDCSGGTLGNISQTVSGFTVGAQYTLTFAQSPEASAASGEDYVVNVTIAGGGTLSQDFATGVFGTSGHSWADWKPQSWTFTANSSSLTFTFAGKIGPNPAIGYYESGIDNIQLSGASGSAAVPTLSEWAMILLSVLLAMVAFFTLRRRLR
jgi:hypothetical protein